MAEHGGYRKPEHPASVSGPGKYSRRTDGGPAQVMSAAPGQAYGDKKAELDAQRVAPMAGTAPLPAPATPGAGSEGAMPAYTGLPLNAPTQRPDEPVTHGVDIGPGGGSDVLGLPNPAQGTGQMTALLQRYASIDTTGILGTLFQAAQARNA
jgi:hypothetical protein